VNWPVAAFGLIGSSYLAGGRSAGWRATHGATSSGSPRFAQQRTVEIAWCDAARGREVDVPENDRDAFVRRLRAAFSASPQVDEKLRRPTPAIKHTGSRVFQSGVIRAPRSPAAQMRSPTAFKFKRSVGLRRDQLAGVGLTSRSPDANAKYSTKPGGNGWFYVVDRTNGKFILARPLSGAPAKGTAETRIGRATEAEAPGAVAMRKREEHFHFQLTETYSPQPSKPFDRVMLRMTFPWGHERIRIISAR
jgi:hypothetical protein